MKKGLVVSILVCLALLTFVCKEKLCDMNMLEKVRKLIAQCERVEPPFTSLGTPYVGLDKESQKVIDLGTDAVPYLCELIPSATPHAAAYIAFCLGQLGDSRAIPMLKETLDRFEKKKDKGPFDYAFIGNAREALQRIGG